MNAIWKRFVWLLAVVVMIGGGSYSQTPDPGEWGALREQAEKWYAKGSYSRAHEVYLRAPKDLPANELRWVDFRRLDTQWRAVRQNAAAADTLDASLKELGETFASDAKLADRDVIWAEAQESLGDAYSEIEPMLWSGSRGGMGAMDAYSRALEYWAGSSDVELARTRYLGVTRKLMDNGLVRQAWHVLDSLPWEIFDNAVRVAVKTEDIAWTRFARAMRGRDLTAPDIRALHRVAEDFEAAMQAAGRGVKEHADAILFHYAEWRGNHGTLMADAELGWRREPDGDAALKMHRQLTSQYRADNSAYWRRSRQRIDDLTRQELFVMLPGIYLPGSEIQFDVGSKNLTNITFRLYPLKLEEVTGEQLNKAIQPGERNNWLDRMSIAGMRPVRVWTESGLTGDRYQLVNKQVVVKEGLDVGAYLLEATPSGETNVPQGDSARRQVRARAMMIVSDVALTLKSSETKTLAWVTDVNTGKPISEAQVYLWYQTSVDPRTGTLLSTSGVTDTQGVVTWQLPRTDGPTWVVARHGNRYASSQPWVGGFSTPSDVWRIHASTDRPAYRPKETVQWKWVARVREGDGMRTPVGSAIQGRVIDPRGETLTNIVVRLNEFGSASGSFPLGEEPVLGIYQIEFTDENNASRRLGQASLFRIEEYRLPEFEVAVGTRPAEAGDRPEGSATAYRLGETLEIEIRVDRYSGGAVADADVEVVINRKPWYPMRPLPRPYPWFNLESESLSMGWGGRRPMPSPNQHDNSELRIESGRSDALGRWTMRLPTDPSEGDSEYSIEARVVDASGREVVGYGKVRVTGQRYYVDLNPVPRLGHPGEKMRVDVRARNANDEPIATEGRLTWTRRRWIEVWLDPRGREVKEEELKALREESRIWPPRPEPGEPAWRMKFRGYESEIIRTNRLQLKADGTGSIDFTPAQEGYYEVAWSSPSVSSEAGVASAPYEPPVQARETFWVASRTSKDLGYRTEGIELILDETAFAEGKSAPVMIVTRSPGRHVLLTIELEGTFEHRVLEMTGTTRLVEIDIGSEHVPNFRLSAQLIEDRVVHQAMRDVTVAPARRFLTIDIEPGPDAVEPGSAGRVKVRVRDHDGEPVRAEVALGLVDESVHAIQGDLAPDPRQFFFGTRRWIRISDASTPNERKYVLLKRTADGEVVFEGQEESADKIEFYGLAAGVGGEAGGADRMISSKVMARRQGMPMAPMAAMAMDMSESSAAPNDAAGGGDVIVVRSDFRSTAFWESALVTRENGEWEGPVTYPDSLTRWRWTARGVTTGAEAGQAVTQVRTRKALMVRMQQPRFLLTGDRATLGAVISNQAEVDQDVDVEWRLESESVAAPAGGHEGASPLRAIEMSGEDAFKVRRIRIVAGADQRVDFPVEALHAGVARWVVTARARASGTGDAMEMKLEVHPRGLEQLISHSGKGTSGDVAFEMALPERRPGSTRLTIQVTPSLAVSLLDALPYLAQYPYGCTEQTLSRFLPAVTARAALRRLGLSADELIQNALNKATSDAQSGDGQGSGSGGIGTSGNLGELDAMVQAGVQRLKEQQNGDGSWGWWVGGNGDAWMTAYVIWGLSLAEKAGVDVGSVNRAAALEWLRVRLSEVGGQPDLGAWMLHALASIRDREDGAMEPRERAAWDRCLQDRDRLTSHSRALLVWVAHAHAMDQEAAALVRNLENSVIHGDARASGNIRPGDAAQPVAHWGAPRRWTRWSDSPVESTALTLRALLAVDPKHPLVEPASRWLLRNRLGARWNNTRDTSLAMMALLDYAEKTGEVRGDLEVEVDVNGKSVLKKKYTGSSPIDYLTHIDVSQDLVRDVNRVVIRRKAGTAPIYHAAVARFFGTADVIEPQGSEVAVRRNLFRLIPQPTLLRGVSMQRETVGMDPELKSGERIEVVVTLEAAQDLEYLMIEDLKAAALESVELKSGHGRTMRALKDGAGHLVNVPAERDSADYSGGVRGVYSEWRDRKSAFFIDRLPAGFWELRFMYRVETPGRFTALPAVVEAMYVPDIRANSRSGVIKVE